MSGENKMAKKLKKDINMLGSIYMTPQGRLYQLYGGWHKYYFAELPKDSKTFKRVVESYGTKDGKKVRAIAIKALFKAGKWRIK